MINNINIDLSKEFPMRN